MLNQKLGPSGLARLFGGQFIVALAMALPSCAGLSSPINAGPDRVDSRLHTTKGTQTFRYTGTSQHFTVPSAITSVAIAARGAGSSGKRGGLVQATISVVPGEVLTVFVGGAPQGLSGGFNGGGSAPVSGSLDGQGGGGASDVRQDGDELSERVVVAGGAGGGGNSGYNDSGKRGPGSFGGGLQGGRGGKGGTSFGGGGTGYGGGGGLPGTQKAGGKGGGGGRVAMAAASKAVTGYAEVWPWR